MADIYGFPDDEVARIAAAVRGFESATPRQGNIPGGTRPDHNFTRIPFRNTSAETIPAYAVMRVTDAIVVDDIKVFTVAKPNTSLGRLYLINGPKEVPQYSAGVEPGSGHGSFLWHASDVLYDTAATPAYGESWGPQDGTWTLKKWRYGFTIKGGNTGSGATAKTIAVQHFVNEVRGKTSGTISADGGTGTVNVYDGDGTIVTGTTITATNIGDELTNGAEVIVFWCGGTWVISPRGAADPDFIGKADGNIDGTTGTVSVWTAEFGADTLNNVSGCYGIGITTGDRVAAFYIYGVPVLVNLEESVEGDVVVFQLTAAKTSALADTAAVLMELVAGVWTTTGTAITVTDRYTANGRGMWFAPNGARGFARRGVDGKYDIIYMQRRDLFVRFQAISDWDGGEFLANIISESMFQHGDLPPAIVAGVQIFDPNQIFPQAKTDCFGLAVFNDTLNRYEVVAVDSLVMYATCELNATLNRFDATASLDVVTWLGQSTKPFGRNPIAIPITADNLYGFSANNGALAHVVYYRQTNRFVLLGVTRRQDTVVFELTATLALGGEAAAVTCDLDAGEYDTTATAITVVDPYQSPGCWSGVAGYRGVATRNTERQDNKFDILWMERKALIVQFELTASVSAGSSAGATVTTYFQHGNKNPGATVTVYDPANIFSTGVSGDKGHAIWNDISGHYEIITGKGSSTVEWHRGTADAAIAKGASGTVSRYTDGTNTDSGVNDTVFVDRENIRAGTVVAYQKLGSNFYEVECEPRFDFYRGTADAAIAKGATGTVSRYTDGTNTDSTLNDSVINDYEYIPSGAKVTYLRLGSNFYAVGVDTAIAIHRGVTSSTSTKGGTCTVDRYIPGTTTDSTINDTVNTPDAAIANGKNITYLEQAGTMYAMQWGKQTLKMVVGTNSPRIKSGNAQIEASCIADVEVDSKETAAFEDKIALTSTCP